MSTTKYSLKVETKDVVFDVRVKDNATKDLIVFEGSNKHKQWSSKLCVIKTDEVFAISCDSSGLLLTGFINGKEVYTVFCNDDGEIIYKLRDENQLMKMSASTTVSGDFYYDGIKEMVRKFHRFYKFKGSHYNTEHNRNKIIRDTSYLSIPTDVVAAIFKGFCDFILAYNQDMWFRQQLEEISDEQINNVIAIVREKHINYIQTSEWRQWIIENPISKI